MEVVGRSRQGDMLIYRISEDEANKIKSKASKKIELKTLTVGVGEVTGHSHDVLSVGTETDTQVTAFLAENESLDNIPAIKNLFFELEKDGVIVHDEHNPIYLEKGFYVRVNQREYNPFTNMYQQVRD